MINVKDQIYDALKGITEKVSDGVPKELGPAPGYSVHRGR